MITQIVPADLAAWRADPARPAPLLVDVREPWEVERCVIEGSLAVPLRELPARLAELPRDRDVVLVCHHGNRSQYAAMWLERNGYARLYNLAGGVERWALEVDPTMGRY